MTPIEYYNKQCQLGMIVKDPEQLPALQQLQHVHHALMQANRTKNNLLSKFKKPKSVKGLYLWGGVGIGKTFLMDCFYHCLTIKEKMRMHFHAFMQLIHHELKQHQGQKNPLQYIAKQFAKKTKVLCFDEFFVSDITDAIILARLFEALFAEGLTLVATSNSAPDDLYKRGLQRQLFLPAIELIKLHTTVLHIASLADYRLRHLQKAGVFFTPLDQHAKEEMEKIFNLLSPHETVTYEPIMLHDRPIQIYKKSDNIIWFDFDSICQIPRSQQDYLVIAKLFHSVFISNIPILTSLSRDKIILFIKLIDVLYDAKIRLIFSAATNVADLYPSGLLGSDFARTRSRLLEMQSNLYFSHIRI